VQGLPAGAWGVPKLLFSFLDAYGGEQKKKKGMFGDTPNPAKGAAAPWNPAWDLLCLAEHQYTERRSETQEAFRVSHWT